MTDYILPGALFLAGGVIAMNVIKGPRGGCCGSSEKSYVDTRRHSDYWRNRLGEYGSVVPEDQNRSSYNVTTSYILYTADGVKLPADLGKSPALHPGLSGRAGGVFSQGDIRLHDRLVRNIAQADRVERLFPRRQGFKRKPMKKF